MDINKLNKIIKKIKNKKVIIWGTGGFSVEVINLLDSLNIDIEFFIDNDESKREFKKKKVFSPAEISSLDLANGQDYIIVIASMYSKEIKKQIKGLNFLKKITIIDFNNLSESSEIKSTNKKLEEFKRYFKTAYINNFDYGYPLHSLNWLNCLKNDDITGFKIKENQSWNETELGFKLISNEIGFRGNYSGLNGNSIIGTSFGMGFAVDEENVWFNLEELKGWNNFSLPVSVDNFVNTVDFYQNTFKECIVLYFPNFPHFYQSFLGWDKDKNIFEFMNWKTDILDILKLQIKVFNRMYSEYQNGEKIFYMYKNKQFVLNLNYYKKSNEMELPFDYYEKWNNLLNKYNKVRLYRVPTKEEVFVNKGIYTDSKLESLVESYQTQWIKFNNSLNHKNLMCYDNLDFEPDDYHLSDSHWNIKGNQKMKKIILNTLGGQND